MAAGHVGNAGRHFTVTVFVISNGRVVLMRHPRLGIWLPPGGHIEQGELPDDAAVREVREETGLDVVLVGDHGPDCGVKPQTRPAGIQVALIGPGHEHIDLIYFAVPARGETCSLVSEAGTCGLGWYTLEEARRVGANEEVLTWAALALQSVDSGSRSAGTRT